MCGIVGALDLTGRREFDPGRLAAMCSAIAHRGPDDEQFHHEPGLALGVRRLSIVDLAGGRQPLANETGEIWVAFNGELFDYPELLAGLESRGHRLATRCDTELWVHRYEEVGEDVFFHARGQFAVSLWDRPRRRLLLARDRVGICPLHWAEADGWLLWGSEIKALLASGLVAARPDPRGVDHCFCFYATGTTRTAFAGVRSLPPGHYLRVENGRPRVVRYWDLDFPDAGEELVTHDPTLLVDEFERRLRKAVRRRLRGDVPVAGYLSGGVDSTLILALGSAEQGRALPAYTVGLDNAGPDESAKAARAAAALGSESRPVVMDRRAIADAYPALIRAAEAPVVDTSSACMVRLAGAVRDAGFKVALTGEGADEALLGYPLFQAQRVQAALGWPLARRLHRWRGAGLAYRANGAFERTPFRGAAGARVARLGSWEVVGRSRETLYSEALWERLAGHRPTDDLDLTNQRLRRWHPLNQAAYVDYRVFLPGLLLAAAGDRANMSASIETRPPFLDEDLIELCAEVHPRYRLRGWTGKWLLRKVAERYLPKEIAWRRKQGFRASFAPIFLAPSRPSWVDELLSRESLARAGWFEPAAVAAARERLAAGRVRGLERVSLGLGFTMVVATQLWHHTFFGGGLADLPAWTEAAR